MNGNLVEFPRKLEWTEVYSWIGTVSGTQLSARVSIKSGQEDVEWSAWNGGAPLGMGLAKGIEEAKECARKAIEAGVVVVRPLLQG